MRGIASRWRGARLRAGGFAPGPSGRKVV